MTEIEIFEQLFELGKTAQDPEGVVVACLVEDDNVILSSPSANDGIRHAEDLLLEQAKISGIDINDKVILYVTLEPCSYRSPKNNVDDCTTIIIKAGIKNIIYAAPDPEYSQEARDRFLKAGVSYQMTQDKDITLKAINLFNNTITIPLTSMNLPRKKTIPQELE
jgi:pyrimidine deaminase RibD-like protein